MCIGPKGYRPLAIGPSAKGVGGIGYRPMDTPLLGGFLKINIAQLKIVVYIWTHEQRTNDNRGATETRKTEDPEWEP